MADELTIDRRKGMTPRTMAAMTAAETMAPIPELLGLRTTAAEARRRMEALDLPFMIVVAPATRKLLGAVLRTALERACGTNGHDPEECPVARHLEADIDFCFAGETLDEVLHDPDDGMDGASALQQRRRRVRQSLPVVVVDEHKVPCGLLHRDAA
jgi:CBS domain-containing protein